MVKVKRIVHLQDKNIAEDEAAKQSKTDVEAVKKESASTTPEKPAGSDAGESISSKEAPLTADGKGEDGTEERRWEKLVRDRYM